MELLLGLMLGIGLSAACGFRVFVPALIVALASKYDLITLSDNFLWIESPIAISILASATAIEVLAYFIPWVDNILDTIMGPAAIIAATILTSSMLVEINPALQWTLALIMGGGTAAAIHTGTMALRATSTATTGGVANSSFSLFELLSSIATSLLAIIFPYLMGLLAIIGVILCIWLIITIKRKLRSSGKSTILVK